MPKALPANRKEYGQIQKSAATTPSEDDLQLINQYALRPVSAEDVTVVPIRLANTDLDRAYERFPKAYLDRFAETILGKSLMVGHDYSTSPAGRVFDAEVRKSSNGGHYLYTRAYMANSNPLTQDVAMGIAKGASIGFQPDTRLCDICGKDYDGYWKRYSDRAQADDEPCSHIVGRTYDGKVCTLTYGGDLEQVEALEESLVWLGCQRGAETSPKTALDPLTKAAHFDALAPAAGGKETQVDEKEILAFREREKALQAEVDRLKPLAEDGQKYRDWQQTEILRLYTSLGEEKAGGAMVAALKAADATTLDGVRLEIDKRHGEAFAQGHAETGGLKDAALRKTTVNSFLFGGFRQGGGE